MSRNLLITSLLLGLVVTFGCESDEHEPTTFDPTMQLDALTQSEYNAFCNWAIAEVGGEGNAYVCGDEQNQTGLIVTSKIACKNSAAPACSGEVVQACLTAIRDNLCMLHAAEECTAFLTCASDGGEVENLDYIILYSHEPPENGINAF